VWKANQTASKGESGRDEDGVGRSYSDAPVSSTEGGRWSGLLAPRLWKANQTASKGESEGKEQEGDGYGESCTDAPVTSSTDDWDRILDSSDSVRYLFHGERMIGRTRDSVDSIPNTSKVQRMIEKTKDIGRGEMNNEGLNIHMRSLYVENLPPEIDEKALKLRFSEVCIFIFTFMSLSFVVAELFPSSSNLPLVN
jgi:hypothetical protein